MIAAAKMTFRGAVLVAVTTSLFAAGCGDNGSDSTSTQTDTAQKTAPPSGPLAGLSRNQCRLGDAPQICRIAAETFGKENLVAAVAIHAPEPRCGKRLAISYQFFAQPDKAAIEDLMDQAYSATFDEYLDSICYVSSAAYKPGDDPFGDFPLYNTSIGSGALAANPGADPRNIWRVDSIDPVSNR